jgi:2-keto-4-pentenoate hydratase/2-oxohepta-3-ene-1,7-dioic acid hydratase in catechol pathway
MKILAIGRNYGDHIKELDNERPDEPVIFTKPDTAILKNNEPFYYPAYSNDIHYEVELIIRVCKEG